MVIVFDFDKTLTKKDTIFGFYKHCNPKWNRIFKDTLYFIFLLFYEFKIINNDRLKKIGVSLYLKGKTRKELYCYGSQYAKSIVLNDIYYAVFLKNYPDAIIASASYREYLLPLFEKNILITSKLEYKDDKVIGLKENAYSLKKKELLLKANINRIDIFYTDSKSDLPVCGISDETIWVK